MKHPSWYGCVHVCFLLVCERCMCTYSLLASPYLQTNLSISLHVPLLSFRCLSFTTISTSKLWCSLEDFEALWKILDDFWWFFSGFDDFGVFLMKFVDFSLILMIFDDFLMKFDHFSLILIFFLMFFSWNSMIFDDFWLFLMIFDHFWSFLVIFHIFSWFLIIFGDFSL